MVNYNLKLIDFHIVNKIMHAKFLFATKKKLTPYIYKKYLNVSLKNLHFYL